MTIALPSGARVWLASGHTDMRKGFDGLALLVQEALERDPHTGHLFVFRGRRGSLIKVLWHDGQGMCLFAKWRPFCLAIDRWARGRGSDGDDHAGAAGIFAGRHRLASAAAHLASASGRLIAAL